VAQLGVEQFDKLLDALLMALSRMSHPETSPLDEMAFTRAMVEALKQGKSFIRPRTFAGGGG